MPIGDLPAQPMEIAQILTMLRKINPKVRSGARDRAIIAVLWRCGLRNAELRDIELSHLSESGDGSRYVRVMKPKGHASGVPPRNVGIDDATWELIEAWMEFRGSEPGLLFMTRHGTGIGPKSLLNMVKARARNAGVKRRVHPHAFRHTYAMQMNEEKIDLLTIQKALGHKSLNTTAIYLAHLAPGAVVDTTSKRRWAL